MEKQKTLDDLLPPAASLWVWLIVGALLAGFSGAAIDPDGPLQRIRLAERTGLISVYSRDTYWPYSAAIVGVVVLGFSALVDLNRVRAWGESRNQLWGPKAYEWCKTRFPGGYGRGFHRPDLEKGRQILSAQLSQRWGRYYALGFGLVVVTFLAGWAQLKPAPSGPEPQAAQYPVFYPLFATTAGVGVVLFCVVVAAQVGTQAISLWKEQMSHQPVDESLVGRKAANPFSFAPPPGLEPVYEEPFGNVGPPSFAPEPERFLPELDNGEDLV